jgi:hypothetical protein
MNAYMYISLPVKADFGRRPSIDLVTNLGIENKNETCDFKIQINNRAELYRIISILHVITFESYLPFFSPTVRCWPDVYRTQQAKASGKVKEP